MSFRFGVWGSEEKKRCAAHTTVKSDSTSPPPQKCQKREKKFWRRRKNDCTIHSHTMNKQVPSLDVIFLKSCLTFLMSIVLRKMYVILIHNSLYDLRGHRGQPDIASKSKPLKRWVHSTQTHPKFQSPSLKTVPWTNTESLRLNFFRVKVTASCTFWKSQFVLCLCAPGKIWCLVNNLLVGYF